MHNLHAQSIYVVQLLLYTVILESTYKNLVLLIILTFLVSKYACAEKGKGALDAQGPHPKHQQPHI
jgi:hypothetical protein